MPSYYISHSSIPGRQNGVRHGPPYPIDASIREAMAARSRMAEKLQAARSKEKMYDYDSKESKKLIEEETKYAKEIQKQNSKILTYLKQPVTGNLQYDNDQVNRMLSKYGEKKLKNIVGDVDPWKNEYDSTRNDIFNKAHYTQAKKTYCLQKYKNDDINPEPSSVLSWRASQKERTQAMKRYGDLQYIILDAIKRGIAEGKSESQIGAEMNKLYKKYQNASLSELRNARNSTTSYKKIEIVDKIKSESLREYYKNRICGFEVYGAYMDEYEFDADLIDRVNKDAGKIVLSYPTWFKK